MDQNEICHKENSIYDTRMNEFCINHLNVPIIIRDEGVKRPRCSISPLDSSALANSDESYLQNSTNLSITSPFVSKINEPSKSYTLPCLPTNPFLETILQENSNTSNSSGFSTSSPYYTNRIVHKSQSMSKNLHLKHVNDLKSIQFQSTPNKPTTLLNIPTQKVVPASQTNRVNFHSILDLAKSDDSKSNDSSSNFTQNPAVSFNSEANSSGYASVSASLNSTSVNNNNSSLIDFNENLKNFYLSCNKENSKLDFISKSKRKPRTQINRQQREILEYAYNLKGYPDSNEIEYLCNILGFEENVIRIWFQNKRARDKQRH